MRNRRRKKRWGPARLSPPNIEGPRPCLPLLPDDETAGIELSLEGLIA